jgi:hypothetical protein
VTKINDWWTPKPMTEEQMQQEIAFSQVKGQPHEEFLPEAITKTLDMLNLRDNYARTTDTEREAGKRSEA